MQYPAFTDGMFVNAALLNSTALMQNSSFQGAVAGLFTPGLLNASALSFVFNSTLNVTVNAGTSFQLMNSAGVLAQANGSIAGSTSTSTILNFAGLVPGSGSVTAYIVASAVLIGQVPTPVIGPPNGHPDYNPSSAPSTAYLEELYSAVFTATTTAPDNVNYYEVARVTLSAGQTSIVALTYSNQLIARPVQAIPSFSGNPNGALAGIQGASGTQPSVVWDTADNLLWFCTTTGNAASAVWTACANFTSLVQYGGANGNFISPNTSGSCSFTFTPTRNCIIDLKANAVNNGGVITTFALTGSGFNILYRSEGGLTANPGGWTDFSILSATAGQPVTITYTLTVPAAQAIAFGFTFIAIPTS